MNKPAQEKYARYVPILKTALIAAGAYFVLFALISAGITPERYDIKVGYPASVTIMASKEVDDLVTTEELREAAAAAVEPSYKSVDPTVLPQVLSEMESQFQQLSDARNAFAPGAEPDDAALAALNRELPVELDATQLAKLLSADDEQLNAIFDRAYTLTRDALNSTVPEGSENAAVARIGRDLAAEGYDTSLVSMVVNVLRGSLKPNMLIDEEITEATRQRARELVETETRVRGEVIVREGELVTRAQYEMLSSLGLIKDKGNDLPLILGVALLVLLLMIAVGLYLYRFERAVAQDPKMLLLLALIFVVVVSLSLFVRTFSPYLMPVTLGLLLVAVLINPRLALFTNFVLAALVSLLTASANAVFTMAMLCILIMSIISGPVIALVLSRRQQRITVLLAGLAGAVTNFLMTLAIGLVSSANTNTVVNNAVYASASAVLSGVLAIGLQPIMELIFNLVTSTKLLELSNPNQPLIRRLLLEAPGTYHHSIIVANLAEAAANAVGGNGLLARVGAYYHDVGKLKRPSYFKENQMGDNPHDRTDPRVSTAIVTAHTRDGVQMAQKARLPEPVIRIIREHHGDTPVIFFYDKAVKLYGEENTDLASFRYEGPRPQSKESAVVMLADSIEAAARSLPNPDPEKLDGLIRKIVRGKLMDGQLDESPLTFADLDRICTAFSTVLSGVFHERIEYPEVNLPPREDAVVQPETREPEAPEEAADEAAEAQAGEGAE